MPGYHAPQDTVGPATRVTAVLGAILVDGAAAGILRQPPAEWLAPPLHADLAHLVDTYFPGVPHTVMARGLIAWTEIFGAVSFELFGRLETIIVDRDAWFAYQVKTTSGLVGLRP